MTLLLLLGELAPAPPPATSSVLCRHCAVRKPGERQRGLCQRCHAQPEVRALYPLESRVPELPDKCLHCGQRKRSRPRGLCRCCHSDRKVRKLYPPVSAFGNRCPRAHNRAARRPLAKRPTRAQPGSAAKIAVLRGRASRCERLWHPDDATLDLS